MTIPGVSHYAALVIYAELGDIDRFDRAKEVVRYVKLNSVVRIENENEKAIRFSDSASARPLMKIAHRIVNLEEGSDHTDPNRLERLASRLNKHRRTFEKREGAPAFREESLPKIQILHGVRRCK